VNDNTEAGARDHQIFRLNPALAAEVIELGVTGGALMPIPPTLSARVKACAAALP
jgi:hypothetical protein